jgi:hypothetical protein
MLVYLFVASSYLFFMSGSAQTGAGNNHFSLFRRKTESTLTVQRIDKTVLTENKLVTVKKSFALAYVKAPNLTFKLTANSQFTGFLPDLHHVYLSNRIIRI